MRLWHYKLIEKLDNKRLLGQHRECCALRGKGWGKKHSTIDYIFHYSYKQLFNYHIKIMIEMWLRNYKVNNIWKQTNYRGKNIGFVNHQDLPNFNFKYYNNYLEHDDNYFEECKKLLLEKDYNYYKDRLNDN